eukprot:COSAG01_NODE_2324_length_7907_cov_69.755763_5_plen_55_part_00
MKKQVSVLNLRSHSISTFNRYDRRILAGPLPVCRKFPTRSYYNMFMTITDYMYE